MGHRRGHTARAACADLHDGHATRLFCLFAAPQPTEEASLVAVLRRHREIHGTFVCVAEGYSGGVDPELLDVIKRYTIVGVVLTGALVWAVVYTPDAQGGTANNAPALEAPVADIPALDAGASASDSALVVVKLGLRRIACGPACDLEASCALRTRELCVNESCEGDVRKINRSDFHLDAAASSLPNGQPDCQGIAASPCEEACWKKAECGGGHGGDAACTAACTSLMKRDPAQTWRQARCVLEVKSCADVARCDQG